MFWLAKYQGDGRGNPELIIRVEERSLEKFRDNPDWKIVKKVDKKSTSENFVEAKEEYLKTEV